LLDCAIKNAETESLNEVPLDEEPGGCAGNY